MIKNAFQFTVLIFTILICLSWATKESTSKYCSFDNAALTDTVAPKEYHVSMPIADWLIADSLLTRSEYFIGRTLSVDDADKEKRNLQAVRSIINQQLNKQLSDDRKLADSLKAKKPK